MKKTIMFIGILLLAFSALLFGSDNPVQQKMILENMSLNPLAFTENHGQWDDRVRFKADAGGANMWFTEEGVCYQFVRRIAKEEPDQDDPFMLRHERFEQESDSFEQLVLKASFVDANPNPAISGKDMMEYKCNYFIGNDPDEWHTDVPNYQSVYFKEIYPGIDLKYYGNGKQMEYDFIVSPGTDYKQIQIHYEGAKSLSVNSSGELIVEMEWGSVTEQKPIVYQMDGDQRQEIKGEYKITNGDTFSFILDDSYNPDLPLMIDPVLIYSTYLGGNDTDGASDIAIDPSGYAYISGCTYSNNFPIVNPYQPTFQGGIVDVFVTKLSSSNSSLIYSTYLGGKNSADLAYGITLDAFDCAFITGATWSTDFPTVNPYQNYQASSDAFVSKLSSEGNSLIYSTYLGGNEYEYAYGIAVDASGCAYITGVTLSADFPTVNPYQTNHGSDDVFITKFSSSGNSLIYSTYLGGGKTDWGWSIALDASGCAYVTGETSSFDFPTFNPYQTFQGWRDAFVTKLSITGNDLIYSTCLGGSKNTDTGQDIAVDDSGCAYIAGWTHSADFPVVNPCQTYQGLHDGFVTKLSSTGDDLIYSTYLGGSSHEKGYGIALDAYGCAYITGSTESPDFPVINPYQTFQGWQDAFVTKLSSTGDDLIYSTYLGGCDWDGAHKIAIDTSGCAYITGTTESTDFPVADPYQTDQGGTDAFVAKFSPALNPWAVIAIDRSGSMYYTDPLGQSRLDRAKSMAHDEANRLLDFYDPKYYGVYQIAVMSFNADSIVLVQDFTSKSTDLHNAIDQIANPRHDTPLAAAMCQAHCMLDQEDATSRLAFIYTDGLENASQNFDICVVCEPCNDLMETGWNYDCDPSNPSSCTEWQLCLADQFAQTGVNIVHYFGEPINPFDKSQITGGLEDLYFLKSAAEESGGEFFYHSDLEADGYICGDANRDFSVNVSDAARIINYVFLGGETPDPYEAGDVNCDDTVNISDAVWIINYVFVGGNIPCDTDGDGLPDC